MKARARVVPNLTDRARRYRAQAAVYPEAAHICHYCGSTRFMTVDHVDGRETNGSPRNLLPACKSCNTAKGFAFDRAGLGAKTRQYNPRAKKTAGGGARSYRQWVLAVLSAKGQSDAMTIPEAVEMIHATSKKRRASFAREIYARRREAGHAPVSARERWD